MVFFIFLVSNIGGMLTPLGDPPLFLGYLQGVPFTWTLRLWRPWLTMTAVLLAIYFVWDTIAAPPRDPRSAPARSHPDRAAAHRTAALNGLWLVGVVAAVAFLHAPLARDRDPGAGRGLALAHAPARSAGRTSSPRSRSWRWRCSSSGIFLTMIPALELLHARGGELGVREPWQFFWATGGAVVVPRQRARPISTFLALGQGLGLPAEVVGVPHAILAAISVGAVAMGANTYIGNAPNFMVKAIAEAAGVRMPSFFGYMLYSGAVLIPLFVAVTLLFF